MYAFTYGTNSFYFQSEFSGPFVHKSTKYNDPNNVKTKENRPPVTNITRDVRISTGRYSPWGWGAGNPERDRHGNVKGKKNTLDKNKVTCCYCEPIVYHS